MNRILFFQAIFIMTFIACLDAGAADYTVVDTNQSHCYDNTTEITCPAPGDPFYGQDSQHLGKQPAYIDNGDGTVTDLNTGLMWQKSMGTLMSWEDAMAGAAKANTGGYTDWRVPSVKELYSLILFSGTDVSPCMAPGAKCPYMIPFIDTDFFDFEYGDTAAGERIIDVQFWTCTEFVSTTMWSDDSVFGVNFADGRIKAYPKNNLHFIRYVRGNTDYGQNDFVDNGDGTITDRATNLMWTQSDSGFGMDWEAALQWVQDMNTINLYGHDDWRLPNAKELQSIVDYTRAVSFTGTAAIDPVFDTTEITDEGGGSNYPYFWTSTTHVDANGSGAWAVYICFGEALGYMKSGWGYDLLNVHGDGAQRSDPKTGDPASYPTGHGPQGDVVDINNFVRLVRDTSPRVTHLGPAFTPLIDSFFNQTPTATPNIIHPKYTPKPTLMPPIQEIPYDTVFVTDDLFSPVNLLDRYDQDSDSDRALAIQWNFRSSGFIDFHIYVAVKQSAPVYLGRTGSGSISYFEWRTGDSTGIIQPEFSEGPAFDNRYSFWVYGIQDNGLPSRIQTQGSIILQKEEAISFQTEIPPGDVVVTDSLQTNMDLSGDRDCDLEDERSLVIRWNLVSQNVKEYYVYASVDQATYQYLGRTGTHSYQFLEWKPDHLLISPSFRKGPEFGHTYKFRVYPIFADRYPKSTESAESKKSVLFLSQKEQYTNQYLTPVPKVPFVIPVSTPTPTVTPTFIIPGSRRQ